MLVRPSMVLALCLWSACLSPATQVCDDGTTCPVGLACDEGHGGCALSEQLAACQGLDDGTPCRVGETSGSCDLGVCLTECGDGIVAPDEVCDDGNAVSGDGCSADCQTDERCGNGILDSMQGEECDCGDGGGPLPANCTAVNADSPGAQCRSDCRAHCGDGEINAAEQCEPGLQPSGDCLAFGFDRGGITCGASCALDFGICGRIGWEEELFPTSITDLSEIGPNHWMAVRRGYASLFDGDTWAPEALGFDIYLWAVWGLSPLSIYGVGEGPTDGTVIVRRESGQWSLVDTGIELGAGDRLTDIWGSAPDNIYVVGVAERGEPTEHGILLHFNGVDWAEVDIGDVGRLASIAGFPDGAAVAVGNGIVLRGSGRTWGPFPVQPDIDTEWYEVDTLDSGADVWVVGNGAWIQHFSATDNAWSGEQIAGQFYTHGLWVRAPDDIFVAGRIYVHHYDGTTWSDLGVFGDLLLAKFVRGPGDDPMLAFSNRVWSYSGSSWSTVLDIPYSLAATLDVHTSSELRVAVVGPTAHIENVGTVSFSDPLKAVWAVSEDEFWVGAETGSLFHCTRGDDDFASCAAGGEAVSADAISDLWVGAGGKVVATTRDETIVGGPGDWTVYDEVTDMGASDIFWDWAAVWAVGDTIYVTGWNHFLAESEIRKFDGAAWSLVATSTTRLHRMWGTSDSDIYAVGNFGTLLHFDGSVWSPAPAFTQQDLFDISGTGPDDIFVAAANALWHFDGQRWGRVRTDRDYPRSLAARSDAVFLGAADGPSQTLDQLLRITPW